MRVLAPKDNNLDLDLKDWRILKEVTQNMREPLSKIARTTLLSRQSVEYRLKLFTEHHLITGSRTVINTRKLGFRTFHIFLEVHTPTDEKSLVERAEKALFVNAIIVYSGKYNLEISITAKDEVEFIKYYEQLTKGLQIRDEVVLLLVSTVANQILPEKYFPKLKELSDAAKTIKNSIPKKQYIPDVLDVKILDVLSNNATITNFELARKFSVSKDTIAYRIHHLEMNQYILGYRPVINFSVLGLCINSVLIKLNSVSTKEFEQFLRANGSILWATRAFGNYDYLLYIVTKNIDEFHDVMNGMKERFVNLIRTYELLFAFQELKYEFMAASIANDWENAKEI